MKINKLIIPLSLVLIASNIVESFYYHERELESEEAFRGMYDRWRAHHNMAQISDHEKDHRFNVFKSNTRHVHRSNQMNKSYKLSVNKFAAMTNHEFRTSYASSKISHYRALKGIHECNETSFMYANAVNLPPSVDWRTLNAVTPAKDQRRCGACWAFSAVVAVEGINAIRTGELVSLSEQHLIDCNDVSNYGCDGGLMEPAFEYIRISGGLATEKDYPYISRTGICDSAKVGSQVVTVDGFEDVPQFDEDSLMKAVAHQPVSIAMDANAHDVQFYSNGVFNGKCTTDVNHGVAAVGYGESEEGMKYWIVKNSWGPNWGEDGFIRIQRGVADKGGLCGVAMQPTYPLKNPNSSTKNHEL